MHMSILSLVRGENRLEIYKATVPSAVNSRNDANFIQSLFHYRSLMSL